MGVERKAIALFVEATYVSIVSSPPPKNAISGA